ncbi:MFS transporter [Streptomyces sp. 1331.2]|uniref:MFS transporter n=1 Tax=Streptomyces sp. 1331.2 TaxID=1938835 RepID=UPI000BDD4605|nr:MFS transporter [Streptomyces sp. 1331.2]SOB86032.1 Predicted arabinose efflux permease, MFS family [Streptomyces sp. 1331.2]
MTGASVPVTRDQGPPAFVRDRLTATAYGGLAVYAYVLYALGPLLPLLRQDLRLSYALMSLHSTAFAAGAMLTNLLFRRLRTRLDHRVLFWSALAALALGSLLLATGLSATVTLAAAVLGGIGGALLQTTALAVLAEHHGGHESLRARALVEANAAASVSALAAPLVISGLESAGAAWNWCLVLPALALAALYPALRAEPLRPNATPSAGTAPPTGTAPEPAHADRPSGSFPLRAALCGLVVGFEFCLAYYAAPLLTDTAHLTDSQASAALALFYGGELVGRLAGSRLTAGARAARSAALVTGSLTVAATGFLALWLASTTWVALLGLVLGGLGVANLFPLTLSLAVSAAPGRTDQATARVQLAVSTCIMLAPLLLGTLSDRLGVRSAFGLAGLLLPLAAALLATGRRRPAPVDVSPSGVTPHVRH